MLQPVGPREAGAAAEGNPSIAPYASGLTGVDQVGNMRYTYMLWGSFGLVLVLWFAAVLVGIGRAHLRRLAAMSLPGEQQAYWKASQPTWMPWLKQHVMYAPLWNKRHNREIRLSSAINVGTLPSRLHAVLLGLYGASNVAYMLALGWGNADRYAFLAELRGRSGTLAAVNMVPLLVFATRNSPLIPMLKISFDTYNLFHRWIGRAVVLETVVHMLAWLAVQLADGGLDSVRARVMHEHFIASGVIGGLALVVISLLSLSPVRHAFYETFLNTHILLAAIIFVCTWVHCGTAEVAGGLPQLPWIVALVLAWLAERVWRLATTALRSRGFVDAEVQALPGEATRVTMHLPHHADVRPGTHAYIRFRDVGLWENHPFSIAWVEHRLKDPTLPLTAEQKQAELFACPPPRALRTSVSFVVGAQTGFTRRLYNRARASGAVALTLPATFEGPYAGHHSLDSYGHAVLIAGATGITHQISYLRHLVDGFNNGTVATRRVMLVWIVRDHEALEWVRPWMDAVLRMPNRRQVLQIRLFVTRPKKAKEITSSSTTVQMFPGRPNIPTLLQKEVSEQVGAMCVTVCGPGALADDVRSAVRTVQTAGTVIDFVEESFTW